MVKIGRGDVVQVDLNPVIGSEQSGIRPALDLQIDRANAKSPHTIIAPFTSRIRNKLLPSHVRVPAGVGGLTQSEKCPPHDPLHACRKDTHLRRQFRIGGLQHPVDPRRQPAGRGDPGPW